MYEVFVTGWSDGHVVEEVTPAKGVFFNLPLSDHGRAGFTATVGPGRNWWRSAMSCAMSGILITRDSVPQWSGRVLSEQQSGPRTFDFTCAEWMSFFEDVPALPFALTGVNDHVLQRRLISDAQSVAGQDAGIILGSSIGAGVTDLTLDAWGSTSAEEEFRRIGELAGGPEWYVDATGTLDAPTRTLVQGDRLGNTSPTAVLEYVEDDGSGQRGGNVTGHPARGQSPGFTAVVAVGAGTQAAQWRRYATATTLLAAGFPRRTKTTQYTDVTVPATLQRHATADLAAAQGMTTSYTLSTFENDPDRTQVARGDTVRVELNSDCYGGVNPLIFETRVLDMAVKVPDVGQVTVDYKIADVQEM